MLSTNLRPPRKVVLRAYGRHLSLEPDNIPPQSALLFDVLGCTERESDVELPEDLVYRLCADRVDQVERELDEEHEEQEGGGHDGG